MKKSFNLALLLILLTYSCSTYQNKQQINTISIPELGSFVKNKGQLWFSSASEIGHCQWKKPLKVKLKQLPFNKVSYHQYSKYIEKSNRINSVAYVDSLPNKPKYLHLEIADKIELTSILNDKTNDKVRDYLSKDHEYKMATGISFSVEDATMPIFMTAEHMLLQQDSAKNVSLIVVTKNERKKVNLNELEIFDFNFSSFCWGENRYHQKRIENIRSGNSKCPKGTYAKAAKIKDNSSYLKF